MYDHDVLTDMGRDRHQRFLDDAKSPSTRPPLLIQRIAHLLTLLSP